MIDLSRVLLPDPDGPITLNEIHHNLARRFQLGELYTMVAGLMNVLAILDAWAKPLRSFSTPMDGESVKKAALERLKDDAFCAEMSAFQKKDHAERFSMRGVARKFAEATLP